MVSLLEDGQQEGSPKRKSSFDVEPLPSPDLPSHDAPEGSSILQIPHGDVVKTSFVSSVIDTDRYRQICGCWWSGNMRVLLITAALFMLITIAQTVAAKIANSDALLADCISMAVDSLTYFLNIIVECLKGSCLYRASQLIVPAISLSILAYFTVAVIQEVLPVIQNGPDEEDDVNAYIVLAFALFGILFDVISIYYFYRNLKRSEGSKLGVNMLAAFLHVGADLARSLTTFTESILILSFGFEGAITDAWACMIVSTTILIGVAYGVFEWMVDARSGCSKSARQLNV
jgi:hypothetical protein